MQAGLGVCRSDLQDMIGVRVEFEVRARARARVTVRLETSVGLGLRHRGGLCHAGWVTVRLEKSVAALDEPPRARTMAVR